MNSKVLGIVGDMLVLEGMMMMMMMMMIILYLYLGVLYYSWKSSVQPCRLASAKAW